MTRLLLKAAIAVVSLSSLISTVTAQSSTQAAAAIQTLDCYNNKGTLQDQGPNTYQSSGYCQGVCAGKGMPVMATTGGSNCLCGEDLPPASDKVSGSNCDTPCQGYDQQNCGGIGFYQVYLSGLGAPQGVAAGSSSSASSSSPTSSSVAKPSVVTVAGTTVLATPTAEASKKSSGGGGGSKVGIAVGVVVGLVAIIAIIAGLVFFFKRRRNNAIEEEHRRNAAISGFVGGTKSETSSTTDPRLDPQTFSQRRNSIGSIADEADFSRRILQVSCPNTTSER